MVDELNDERRELYALLLMADIPYFECPNFDDFIGLLSGIYWFGNPQTPFGRRIVLRAGRQQVTVYLQDDIAGREHAIYMVCWLCMDGTPALVIKEIMRGDL